MKAVKYILSETKYIVASIVLIIIIGIVGTGTNDISILSNYFSLAVVIGFVSCCLLISITGDFNIDNFYKRLSVGFGAVGVLYIFLFMWVVCDDIKYEFSDKYITLKLIMELMQIVLVIWAILERDNKCSFRKLLGTFLVIDMAIIYYLNYCDVLPACYIEGVGVTAVYYGSKLVCVILTFVEIVLIYDNRDNLGYYAYLNFMCYGCISFIRLLLVIHNVSDVTDEMTVFLRIVNFIRYYYMFKMIFIDTIKVPKILLFNETIQNKEKLEKELEVVNENKQQIMNTIKNYVELINMMPEGVSIYKDGRLIYMNKILLDTFGLENMNEIKGLPRSAFLSEEDNSRINLLRNEYGDRGVMVDYKISYNGQSINVNSIMFIARSDNEVYDISITRDMKQYEELYQKNEMIKKQQHENELKNHLLINITHEFKTPVNVITSCLQMQKVYFDEGKYEDAQKYISFMYNNCNRLLRLINNFIDSLKYEDGNIKAETKVLNIVPLVERIAMSVVPFAHSTNNTNIIFDTDEEELYCDINVDLLDRIVLNLISNSIKYGRKNGEIKVNIKENGKFNDIIITDNGIGIPEDKMHLLFNRFERIDRTLSRTQEGTGLGLSIVKSIVEFMHGTVSIDSTENVGTTVTVSLPARDASEAAVDDEEEEVLLDTDIEGKIEIEFSDIYQG